MEKSVYLWRFEANARDIYVRAETAKLAKSKARFQFGMGRLPNRTRITKLRELWKSTS